MSDAREKWIAEAMRLNGNVSHAAMSYAQNQTEHANRRLCAATEALRAHLSTVPDGFVLVPVEPTDAMLFAYTKCITEAGFKWARHQWAAMIAAAPK